MLSSQIFGNHLYTYSHALSEFIEKEILDKDAYVTQPSKFYYTLLHKLRNILDTTSLLLVNMDDKPHYTDSIWLLLRTCLLDVINFYFVAEKENDEQTVRIQRIMCDHIRAIYPSASEHEKFEIRERFSEFFENNTIKRIEKVSFKIMHNEIKSDFIRGESEIAFRLYNIFSKVEHNGAFSFDMLHGWYVGAGKEKAKRFVYDAIGIIIIAINTMVIEWVALEDPQRQQLIELGEKMINYTGDQEITT